MPSASAKMMMSAATPLAVAPDRERLEDLRRARGRAAPAARAAAAKLQRRRRRPRRRARRRQPGEVDGARDRALRDAAAAVHQRAAGGDAEGAVALAVIVGGGRLAERRRHPHVQVEGARVGRRLLLDTDRARGHHRRPGHRLDDGAPRRVGIAVGPNLSRRHEQVGAAAEADDDAAAVARRARAGGAGAARLGGGATSISFCSAAPTLRR